MLAVPALVVLLGACAAPGTAAAAQAAVGAATVTPSVAGVTWHKINLLHGWKAASRLTFGTRAPSWAVSGGIVYLDGGLQAPATLGSLVFGVLPAPARPARTQYINVIMGNNAPTTTYVTIAPNGVMYLAGNVTALSFSSLNGISFPATATARHKLTLINGWKSAQAAWNTGDPAYTVSGGVVYLSGSLSQSTAGGPVFAVLPKAIRPATVQYLPAYTFGGVIGRVQIYPDGLIFARFGQSRQFTSLAGVSYLLPTTALHKLTLIHGWKSGAVSTGSSNPAYSLTSGVVCLSGTTYPSTTSFYATFTTLPPAVRPRYNLFFYADINNAAGGVIGIEHAGPAFAVAMPLSNPVQMASLGSICYPVNS